MVYWTIYDLPIILRSIFYLLSLLSLFSFNEQISIRKTDGFFPIFASFHLSLFETIDLFDNAHFLEFYVYIIGIFLNIILIFLFIKNSEISIPTKYFFLSFIISLSIFLSKMYLLDSFLFIIYYILLFQFVCSPLISCLDFCQVHKISLKLTSVANVIYIATELIESVLQKRYPQLVIGSFIFIFSIVQLFLAFFNWRFLESNDNFEIINDRRYDKKDFIDNHRIYFLI